MGIQFLTYKPEHVSSNEKINIYNLTRRDNADHIGSPINPDSKELDH